MKLLVTGANSFIGRNTIPLLLEQGLALCLTGRAQPKETLPDVPFVPCDLSIVGDLENLPRNVDGILHLAGASSDQCSIDALVRGNIISMMNLTDYATRTGAGFLIFASTVSVHGTIDSHVLYETTPMVNPTAYGETKRTAERVLQSVAERLPSVALRLPGVVGCGATRIWLASLRQKADLGERITIFNPDAAFNNLLHVADFARLVGAIAHRPLDGFHAFPVASQGAMAIREVAERIVANRKSRSPIDVSSSEEQSFTVDSSYAEKTFQFRPMPVDQAIDAYTRDP
jgi:UDP-glucose 4-epimerase